MNKKITNILVQWFLQIWSTPGGYAKNFENFLSAHILVFLIFLLHNLTIHCFPA